MMHATPTGPPWARSSSSTRSRRFASRSYANCRSCTTVTRDTSSRSTAHSCLIPTFASAWSSWTRVPSMGSINASAPSILRSSPRSRTPSSRDLLTSMTFIVSFTAVCHLGLLETTRLTRCLTHDQISSHPTSYATRRATSKYVILVCQGNSSIRSRILSSGPQPI